MIQEDLKLFTELAASLLSAEQKEPVATPVSSDRLFNEMDLSLPAKGLDAETYRSSLETLLRETPKTATPRFFNQLFGGRNGRAVLGDLLAVLLNNSMYTYKVAGPMVGVEKVILRKISDMVGFGAEAGGTFAPGGSLGNFMAMLMARDVVAPEARTEGSQARFTAYTSAESHYSIPKNAAFMGIGRKQVRNIPVNDQGQMQVEALEAQIIQDREAGFTPFFINATAGTTVLGAFDPLEAIAEVAERQGLWLHVDGAYCGAVIFSERYRGLVRGIERAHSFAFNAHKMLGTPLSCSILVTRDEKRLYDSFSNEASYLYQTDDDAFNPGKTSLQCGRRNDALKLWTLWRSVGTEGLEAMVNKQFALADIARQYVREHPDYQLHSFDDSISVCFSYKHIPADLLCTRLYEAGELMVGHGSFQHHSFVRLVTINAGNEKADILNFFHSLEAFAEANLTPLPRVD